MLNKEGDAPFAVSIDKQTTTSDLKKAIYQECFKEFSPLNTDAKSLKLHLVKLESPVDDVEIVGIVSMSEQTHW